MKKFGYLLLLLGVSALCVASCNDDEDDDELKVETQLLFS